MQLYRNHIQFPTDTTYLLNIYLKIFPSTSIRFEYERFSGKAPHTSNQTITFHKCTKHEEIYSAEQTSYLSISSYKPMYSNKQVYPYPPRMGSIGHEDPTANFHVSEYDIPEAFNLSNESRFPNAVSSLYCRHYLYIYYL